MIGQYLKNNFKAVQMKFLAMHVKNKKIHFRYIYGRKLTKYPHGT